MGLLDAETMLRPHTLHLDQSVSQLLSLWRRGMGQAQGRVCVGVGQGGAM